MLDIYLDLMSNVINHNVSEWISPSLYLKKSHGDTILLSSEVGGVSIQEAVSKLLSCSGEDVVSLPPFSAPPQSTFQNEKKLTFKFF